MLRISLQEYGINRWWSHEITVSYIKISDTATKLVPVWSVSKALSNNPGSFSKHGLYQNWPGTIQRLTTIKWGQIKWQFQANTSRWKLIWVYNPILHFQWNIWERNITCIFNRYPSGDEIVHMEWWKTMHIEDVSRVTQCDLPRGSTQPPASRNPHANHTSWEILCISHQYGVL